MPAPDVRQQQLQAWLQQLPNAGQITIETASDDASFRRYFRVFGFGDTSLIAMDAPTEHEDCAPFVAVAQLLRQADVNAPEVLAQDLQQGFLLLSDLGNDTYLQQLNKDSVDTLYTDAISALLAMQRIDASGLPPYDDTLLEREMQLFEDWYLGLHLNLRLDAELLDGWRELRNVLIANAKAQPQVFVHRDYHSRNLMMVGAPSAAGQNAACNPGVLDFQDAVHGPLMYDLVSMLKDCYINWPRQQVVQWLHGYNQQAKAAGLVAADVEDYQLQRWFDLMGLQRHLKAIGIFCRLNYRDNKARYLDDIPRTLAYVHEVQRLYPDLPGLSGLLLRVPLA